MMQMPDHMVAKMEARIAASLVLVPADTVALVEFVVPELGYGTHGCRGSTDVFMKLGGDGIYEARMGFDLFGGIQDFGNLEVNRINPFDEKYHDNYVSGRGITREAALRVMLRNIWEIGESLWE